MGCTAGTQGKETGGAGGKTKDCSRIGTRNQTVGLEWAPKEESGEKEFGAFSHRGIKQHRLESDQLSPKLHTNHQSNPLSPYACSTLLVFHSVCQAGWAHLPPIALTFHYRSGDRLVTGLPGF